MMFQRGAGSVLKRSRGRIMVPKLQQQTPVLVRAVSSSSATSTSSESQQKQSSPGNINESLVPNKKNQLTTIRLYRLMLRSCRLLEDPKSGKATEVLLQTNLSASDWGRHSIFTPPASGDVVNDVYRLFYLWNEELDDDEEYDRLTYLPTLEDWYYQVQKVSQDPGERGEGEVQSTRIRFPFITSGWTTPEQVAMAIQHAFRCDYSKQLLVDDSTIAKFHAWCIQAIRDIQQQALLWKHSSVCVTNGVKVVATSRCIGMTAPTTSMPPSALSPSSLMPETKYRFSYRIRIENTSSDCIQVLGRHWNIQEYDGDVSGAGNDSSSRKSHVSSRDPIVVNAPFTGAVGHLPVLKPGQCFEYMSGTDLATKLGLMKGHFYVAVVPPETPSLKSGDSVDELLQTVDPFEATVEPFVLEAE